MFITRGKRSVSSLVRDVLETTTVRDFDGGLNVADNDLNTEPKYAKILDNTERGLDGSMSVRRGTRFFKAISPAGDTSDIVNGIYFNDFIVCVQVNGSVTVTDGAGITTLKQIGGVNPWTGPIDQVNFSIFNSDLTIHDGIHKPLIIYGKLSNPNYMDLDFLQDIATLSNVNTPIGRYVATHGRYTVIAGFDAEPSTIAISARDTSGTYVSDPAPNDAVNIDLGSRVPLGSPAITGLASYRDKLIVTFERGILPITLGVYTGSPAVHTPTDDGFIAESGCLTHRSLINIGDDTYFCDNVGVNNMQRVSLLNTLRPKRASYLIDPLITTLLKNLTPGEIQKFVFAIYDLKNSRYILFIPVISGGTVQESIGFSYMYIPDMKIAAWARIRGWAWRAGWRTSLQRLFFSRANRMYYVDDDAVAAGRNVDFYADPTIAAGQGVAISFDWELPWVDLNKRLNSKVTKHLHIDATGGGAFTVRMYTDNFYNPVLDTVTPALTMDFSSRGALGWGTGGWGTLPWGGGLSANQLRTSFDERLYSFPAKFNIMKMRFSGSVTKPLTFVSFTFSYVRGTVRRP